MKTELVLELRDVYGGDGEKRQISEEVTKLKRTKKRTETRSDIGLQVSGGESEEEATEEVEKDIQTFRKDEEGNPIMRLGGTHGKLYGALKDSASMLRLTGVSPFKSGYKSILNSISISPVWVKLETDSGEIETVGLPQILASFKKTMIVQQFDVIPKCRIKMELSYPEAMQDAIEKMVKGLENISMLNKRRATCKILQMKAC